MKFQDLVFDQASGVYVNQSDVKRFDYLDGSEQYLHEVLKSTGDPGLLSAELKSRVRDWPSLYHLSPYRATILDCFDFQNKEAKVLELGAGCGAVTRWLGERFQEVHAVEGSFQRAGVARLRCKDLPSVKIYATNFFDLDIQNQFDIVTLIGVLEYSHLFHPAFRGKPYEAALAALQQVHGAINDQGILVLAIENKFGLKYFSGAREDHSGKLFDGIHGYPDSSTPVTFSALELDRLLRDAGFTTTDFYLPFPDYKLATTIINAQALSSYHHYLYNWIETPFPDRVAGQRTLLFNESLAIREITKSGLLKGLSNSFLISAYKGKKGVVDKDLGFPEHDWIAKHYSLNRHTSFCKKVTLCQNDSGSLEVRNNVAFRDDSNAIIQNSFFTNTLATEKAHAGDLLLFSMFEMLASGISDSLFQDLLKKLELFLLNRFSTDKKDESGMPLLRGESVDVALWNIIVEENTGEWIIFDREWSFKGEIPVDFIICRNLIHLFTRYEAYFDHIEQYSGKSVNELTYEAMLKIYPDYTKERFTLAAQFDKSFQNFVNNGAGYRETLPVAKKLLRVSDNKESQRIEEETKPSVSIVIPVFNKVEYTKKCLEALAQNTPGDLYEIIIVENASTDGTKDFLKGLKDKVRIITNESNLGFARACNQGINVAKGKYVLLLNNDTIPQPGWLENMLAEAKSDPKIGIVGSCLLYPDTDIIQHVGVIIGIYDGLLHPYHIHRLRRLDRVYDARRSKDYQAVTGACMLIRRDIFDHIGLLDEDYINSYEDVDFCLRVVKAGFRIRYCHRSRVYHYESITPNRRTHDHENVLRLNKKWLGKVQPDESPEATKYGLSDMWSREKLRNNPDDKEAVRKLIAVSEWRGDLQEASEWKVYLQRLGQDNLYPSGNESVENNIPASIVIPVFNKISYTKKCLEAITQDTPQGMSELILIDNASTDGTKEFLKSLGKTVKIITNDKNMGYTIACNQGAEMAAGKYIVFLNNDTVPQQNWLKELIGTADSDSSIGAVGAKLVYPNGRLQEAGGIVFSDGSGWNFGNGDDPDKEIYNQICEVDYCSGACLLVRRDLFRSLGGFDTRFAPAYYEETDLCFGLRKSGYKVIYNPRSVVVHHESVTAGKNTTAGLKRYIEINRKKFVEKWKDELLYHDDPPAKTGSLPVTADRKRLAKKKVPILRSKGKFRPAKVLTEANGKKRPEQGPTCIPMSDFSSKQQPETTAFNNDTVSPSMKALVFFPHNLYPPQTGAHQRCISMITALKELGYGVTLFSSDLFTDTPWRWESINGLQTELGIKVQLYKGTQADRRFIAEKVRNEGEIVNWDMYIPPGMNDAFGNFTGSLEPDLIMINYAYWGKLVYGDRFKSYLKIMDTHDLITSNARMRQILMRHLGAPPFDPGITSPEVIDENLFSKLNLGALSGEYAIYDLFNYTIAISPNEADSIRNHAHFTKIEYIPMTIPAKQLDNVYNDSPVFVIGPNPFNIQGYLYFARKVLPLILHQAPEFSLRIIGSYCDQLVAVPGIQLMGFVPDLQPFYTGSKFAICPLIGGTGQQVKIVEAMAHGVPVITMKHVAESSPIKHGHNGFIVQSAAEFAELTVQLFRDRGLCRKLGEAARSTISEHFSHNVLVSKLGSILEESETDRAVHRGNPPTLQSSQLKNENVQNLLWVRTDSIGDAVLASSMLPYIRQKYPNARIAVVCQQHIAELYEACPFVDKIIKIPTGLKWQSNEEYKEVLQRIREIKPDILMNSTFTLHELAELPGMEFIRKRFAFRNTPYANYTDLIPTTGRWKPELDRHRDFLAGLGIHSPVLQPVVWLSQADREFADNFFRKNNLDPLRSITVLVGTRTSQRYYDPEQYANLLNDISARHDLAVVLIGGNKDKNINSELSARLTSTAIDLAGKTTLRQMAAVIERAKLYLGTETSASHIACAVGTPNVVLLGGGHFGRFMPYSPLTSVVCLPLECYGCNWQCRYQRVHCVRDVLPEVFSEAIQVTLERPSNKPRVFVQGESLWSPNINQPKWQWFDRYLDINLVEIHPVGEVPAMNRAGSRNNPIDSDTPEELNAHAEKIFQRGDREEAKKVLVDLTGRWPTYAKALNNLGVIYRDEGSNQEAEEYFSRAFEVAPRDKNIVLNAGKMLISQKQYEIVKQLYRLFLENNPQAEEIREALEILEKTQA